VLKLNEYIRRFEDAIQTSPIVRSYEIHVDRKTDDIAFINGMADMPMLQTRELEICYLFPTMFTCHPARLLNLYLKISTPY